MTAGPRLVEVGVPDFGMPDHRPRLPIAVYRSRLDRLRAAMVARSLDVVVVYADREHSANLAFLTGFDPRFEEALLIVGHDGEPLLLAGNECLGMAAAAPLPVRTELFQDFSLPGQPRDRSRSLSAILRSEDVGPGRRVGVIGWKQYADPTMIEIPAFIVDQLRGLVGTTGTVVNVVDVLIDPADGLKVINDADQLAQFEWAACQTSQGVRRLLFGLHPGLREDEAVALLGWNGTPLSCHLMLTAGERARLGLLSPGDRPIERGDPFTVAFGIWGALNCRAGFVAESEADLPAGVSDYVDRLVAPYFAAIAEWYRTIRIGVTGGTLHEIVERHLGDPFFGVTLNPGHQIHLDEWVNSPVAPGSRVELRSGMALQVDVIPATGGPYFTTNIEDGIALADESLRAEIASSHPDMWRRIQARRAFMRDSIGIDLHPDVLPFSNFPACLPPYLLRPDFVMSTA